MDGKFLRQWVGERAEDLFLTVFLSPQPKALQVNLEMGEQKAWASVGYLSPLYHLV